MNVAFVDDEISERINAVPFFLKGFSEHHIHVHRFDFYPSAEEFLQQWKEDSYDLIILDILMDGISGIKLGHIIRQKNADVRIVFCSSSNEYANESYDVGACYYIQKPVNQENVEKMIQKFDIQNFELRRFIILPDGKKLLLRNVIYSQYTNHSITIFMKKGEPIKTWMSQNDFTELLANYNYFLPCNSGTIVNLYEVSNQKDNDFIMTDKSVQPISRRRKKEVLEKYQQFLLNSIAKEL